MDAVKIVRLTAEILRRREEKHPKIMKSVKSIGPVKSCRASKVKPYVTARAAVEWAAHIVVGLKVGQEHLLCHDQALTIL